MGDGRTRQFSAMILGARGQAVGEIPDGVIGRITHAPVVQPRDEYVLVCSQHDAESAEGYAAVLCAEPLPSTVRLPAVHSIETGHLSDGDIVGIDRRGYVRTLYRQQSPHNFIFATDRCNSLCLMCSQPPREIDETGIVERHLRLVRLIDPTTKELGITGGEPTLLGEGLIRLIAECRDRLPATALHVLSNGRRFAAAGYADHVGAVRHPDIMFGIPVYSDIDSEHDYVVQSQGAFGETIRGLQNLALHDVPVEIRVVVHRLTYERLPQLAEFIYRNLTFVSQVVIMGLEITGYTVPNLSTLWIDPADYAEQLRAATVFLANRGIRVWIYNHQLCTVPRDLWPFCRQSISDWKNEYVSDCAHCAVRNDCGGFFASAVARGATSRAIGPVKHTA